LSVRAIRAALRAGLRVPVHRNFIQDVARAGFDNWGLEEGAVAAAGSPVRLEMRFARAR